MANIKIDLTHPLQDGETIVFKAPCDCTAVTGMVVHFPNDDGSALQNQSFAFRDSHNNDLTGLGNLFSEGALVVALVNRVTGTAQLLNADTNKYLEVGMRSNSFTVTLPVANWVDFAQTINDERFVVEGFDYIITMAPETLVTSGGVAVYAENVVTDGSIVFKCGSVPEVDLTMNVLKVGVNT